MNTIFIIGNGFDISLDMNTKYSDFYDTYKNVVSDSRVVNELKASIKSDVENWSDLERRFGEHTVNLNGLSEVDELMKDIEDNLAVYLKKEETNFNFTEINKEKLYQYFLYPEKSLLPLDENWIKSFRPKFATRSQNTSIITFNYTKTLERLFEGDYKNLKLGVQSGHAVMLKGIEHVHGYLDERMILGVNDKSQIFNESLKKDKYAMDSLIKSRRNRVQKHLIDDKCEELINKANLICIFGSSIGPTDKLWWEIIGEQLQADCYLIIFDKCDVDIDPRQGHLLDREGDIKREKFLSMTSLSEEIKEKVRSKILVGLDTNMFKDIVSPVKELVETK